MIIKNFPSGPFETNAYVVACSHSRKAMIVDPAPASFNALIAYIAEQNLHPIIIVLTHSHWDHIADTSLLKAHYHIPVAIHPLDTPNLQKPGSDGLPCWIDIQGVEPDRLLNENEIVEIGDMKFDVIHTPGHTPGSICLYCPAEQMLISGDTLFKGTIGNLSFPTSVPDQMWSSLQKLAKLPPSTRVFPGHGPSTTIDAEHWLARAKEIFGNY